MKQTLFYITLIILTISHASLVLAWRHVSPYAYCAGDPVNCVDPTGESTQAVLDSAGHYTIKGGDIYDNDRNIYLMAYDQDGNLCNTGIIIGRTPTITSFYNSDSDSWSGTIDCSDNSGIEFLTMIYDNTPSLLGYMWNARNEHQYDFKATNGTDDVLYNEGGYYRGMPLGVGKDGVSIYTSAREIGNMGAGIVARKSGLSWKVARFGFDLYQSRNTLRYHPVMNPYGAGGFLTLKWQPEGISTQNAERFGYNHPIRVK